MSREPSARDVALWRRAASLLAEKWGLDKTIGDILRELRGAGVHPQKQAVTRDQGEGRQIALVPEQTVVRPGSEAATHGRLAQALVAMFARAWNTAHPGISGYVVTGSDAGAAKRLATALVGQPSVDAEVERRLRIAFADRWFFPRASLTLFVSQWNRFAQPAVDRSQYGSPEPELREIIGVDEEGRPIYR